MVRNDPHAAKPKNGIRQLLVSETRHHYRHLPPRNKPGWIVGNMVLLIMLIAIIVGAISRDALAIQLLGIWILLLALNNLFLVRLLLNRLRKRNAHPGRTADTFEPLTAGALRQAGRTEFGYSPMFRPGYRRKAVDALLERVAQRLEGHGNVTADEVRNAEFRKPKIFASNSYDYHPEEVNKFLNRVIATLEALDYPRQDNPAPPQTDSGDAQGWPTTHGQSPGKAHADTASTYELNHHSGQIY